jgi:hypothetical protein
MAEVLITQRRLAQVLGAARLLRFVHAGWLAPVQRTPSRVLYRVSDIHAVLQKLERGQICPPDRIESARTNGSAVRHGRGYMKKGRKVRPTVWDLNLDFSTLTVSDL